MGGRGREGGIGACASVGIYVCVTVKRKSRQSSDEEMLISVTVVKLPVDTASKLNGLVPFLIC